MLKRYRLRPRNALEINIINSLKTGKNAKYVDAVGPVGQNSRKQFQLEIRKIKRKHYHERQMKLIKTLGASYEHDTGAGDRISDKKRDTPYVSVTPESKQFGGQFI